MSITVGALAILFFLIPGLLFRKAFFVLPFDKRFTDANNISELGIILIVSLVIHYIGLCFLEKAFPLQYKEIQDLFTFFREILLVNGDGQLTKAVFDGVDFEVVMFFQAALWIIAVIFGLMINSLVRYYRLDRKYRIFRFGNSWYYYFSGEAIEFPDIGEDSKQIDYIFVDALVKAEGREILYIGILSEYDLSSNGGLKSFSLKGAKRRFLEDSNESAALTDNRDLTAADLSSKYYSIPSNLLVIPYNENVININFRYFADDDDDEPQSDNTSTLELFLRILSLAIIIIGFVLLLAVISRKFFRNKETVEEDTDEDSEENGNKDNVD